MTQITQGAHVYLFPEPGQVYRVQADDVATVQVLYGAPSAVITLTAESRTFGPYDSPAKLKVTANTAAAEYTLLRAHYAELTQAQIDGGAVGALASNNAGGVIEPDGDVPTLGGAVTLPAMQAAFDAGTAPQKDAFKYSVSVYGKNLIVNGTFDSPAGWTLSAGLAIAGGVMTSTGDASKYAVNSATVVAGGLYMMCWRQVGVTGTTTFIIIKTPYDVSVTNYINTDKSCSVTFRAPASGNIAIVNYSGGVVYDNVELYRLA